MGDPVSERAHDDELVTEHQAEVGMLPDAVQIAPDGSLIVAQGEPIPAIRSVDRPGGTITTLARGR